MSNNKISVSRALKRLVILNKAINDGIYKLEVVYTKKDSEDMINGVPVETIKEETKKRWQSLNDKIEEYHYLKGQITKSNAETYVSICGKQLSVAAILEMKKNSFGFHRSILDIIERQLRDARHKAEIENQRLTQKASDMVQRLMGDKESKSEKYMETLETIVAKERVSVVDPIRLPEEILKLRKFVDEFSEEVDSALDESNATTMIPLR